MNLKIFTISFMLSYVVFLCIARYNGGILGAEQVVLSTAFMFYLLFQIPRKRKKRNM